MKLLGRVGSDHLGDIAADDLLLLRGVALCRHLHFVDDKDHLVCLVVIDCELSEMRGDIRVEHLTRHDKYQDIRRGDRAVGDLVVVGPLFGMDARRVGDHHAVPNIAVCPLCRDARADGNVVPARQHADDGGFARAVLPHKNDVERSGFIGRRRTLIRRSFQRFFRTGADLLNLLCVFRDFKHAVTSLS